ncbi:CACTA en-spm transposon protein [Cucumis melo var. makuwa]|uniref:CACTA en-spm transposon protein n=1 Tax=Cucumis melo var. makuwa TaxID=1194695 RepID=A0A5D3B8Y3_CUCMM|nr:CACTA en-spm transposon protein [Cucumis melo var. makuwa]TYJ96312.1 CACTA en-spm transposon protein [Cucumis melo var. makuwa]
MRLSLDVWCYNGCIVGGVRFYTLERDSWRTAKNSEVMVIGESNASGSGNNNFYHVLNEVLHVQYLMERSVGGTMMSFSSGFDETYAMFLELGKDLNNNVGGSSSMGDNSDESLETTQPSSTPRCVQSRLLKLEWNVHANGIILMSIAFGEEEPISPYAIWFSQAIDVCVRKTFLIYCLRWADVGREYIEIVKGDLPRFFTVDFNN